MKCERSDRFARLAVSLLLLGPWVRAAAAQLLGLEFQVNTYTTNRQSRPAVAADGSGHFVVVWDSLYQEDSVGVFAQRFSSTGLSLGGESLVNSYTTGVQETGAVAMSSSGNFVVVWNAWGQDGDAMGVFGQRFDSAGSPAGGEFQVNTYAIYGQDFPQVDADGAGDFVVVWDSLHQDGSHFGVFGQRYNSEGVPLGIEFQVNSYTTGEQSHSSVAVDVAGNFVATYDDHVGPVGSSPGGFARFYDSTGTPTGPEFRVNPDTTAVGGGFGAESLGSGKFILFFSSNSSAGRRLLGQQFDEVGNRLGSEFVVDSYIPYNVSGGVLSAAADDAGNFVVVWGRWHQGVSAVDVVGRRFDSVGNWVGSEFQVNTYTTGSQSFPDVAAIGSGDFVVVWESTDGQDGSGTGVFGQRLGFANSIFAEGFEAGDACTWSAAVGGGCP